MSDKPVSSQNVSASRASEAVGARRSSPFIQLGVKKLSVCLSASPRDWGEIQQAACNLNNCFQMSFLISGSHYLWVCVGSSPKRRDSSEQMCKRSHLSGRGDLRTWEHSLTWIGSLTSRVGRSHLRTSLMSPPSPRWRQTSAAAAPFCANIFRGFLKCFILGETREPQSIYLLMRVNYRKLHLIFSIYHMQTPEETRGGGAEYIFISQKCFCIQFIIGTELRKTHEAEFKGTFHIISEMIFFQINIRHG